MMNFIPTPIDILSLVSNARFDEKYVVHYALKFLSYTPACALQKNVGTS